MSKRLKIRIAKFHEMIVVEQLELVGSFSSTPHIIIADNYTFLENNCVHFLKHDSYEPRPCVLSFYSNKERDKCVSNIIKWISEEQFSSNNKLEIGKTCLVSNDRDTWCRRIYIGKLPSHIKVERPFLSSMGDDEEIGYLFTCWKYAKSLNEYQPKIEGEIYTWEM